MFDKKIPAQTEITDIVSVLDNRNTGNLNTSETL